MIGIEDNDLHLGSDNPYWNESGWFQIPIPAWDMNGWVYFWHRPNMHLSCGGAAFYDRTGEDTYNCRYYQLDEHQAFPSGANMHDFTLDNGLTIETIEPLMAYRIGYKNEHCELDVEWRAIMEPHEQRPPSPEMVKSLGLERMMAELSKVNQDVSPGQEGYGDRHYDQAGHVQGTVTISGQRYEVDSPSLRDRSWGPRRAYPGMPRAGWGAAIASQDSSFHYMAISLQPVESDPIVGTVEHIIKGWYTKEGVQSELVSGTRRVVERDPDGRPLRVLVEAKDALGRDLQATARLRALLRWPWMAIVFVWDCMLDWEFDGQSVTGEEFEYYLTTRRDRRFPQYNELANTTTSSSSSD